MYRIVLITVALAALIGCDKRKEPEFTMTSPAVPWRDLIDEEVKLPDDDYCLLADEPTSGLFPISLAVARIAAVRPDEIDPPEPGEYKLALEMEPSHDFLRWNSAFDDVRPVSEVFPLSRISLNGQGVSIDSMVDAAQAMTGRVCLIYATTDLSATESEIRGALYDADSKQALAAIHARGIYTEPNDSRQKGAQSDEPESELEKLLAPCTPHLVAEHRFGDLVRECMLELLENDLPAEPAPEEGWVPEGPLAPQIWPPLHLNYCPVPNPYTALPCPE